MALTTAQQVRTRIQDYPRLVDQTYAGDGTALAYLLPNRNLTTASAYVSLTPNTWATTGATFDPTAGQVSFTNVISANSAWRVAYTYTTFSDEEIDIMITAGGGNVNGASIEAVQALMFDGLKRSRWAAPNGQSYDDTAALAALKDLYSALKNEEAEQAATFGGIAAWGLNQSSY